MPQIEVSFDIDANGILKVSAKDRGTGKEQNITISGSGGLSDDEIKEMVTDAEGHAEEDQERRRKVEAHNRLDQMIYTTEKTFEETKEKLSAEDKGEFETTLADARKALESDDTEAMDGAAEKLTALAHKMAEKIYQDAGAGQPGGPTDGGQAAPADEEEVIDAEYVDVEDKD